MRHLALSTARKRLSRILCAGGAGLAVALTALPATGALAGARAPGARANETTISQNSLRDSWDNNEPSMSPTAAAGFTQLFARQVTGQVWAQPLVVGSTLIVATEKDYVYGLDAATGAIKWTAKLGKFYTITRCNDLSPDVGVTAAPVYDPQNNRVYVMAQVIINSEPAYELFGVNVTSGKIVFTKKIGGHPSNDGNITFNATNQLARPGLLLLDGWVYSVFGSHCDHKPYVGYISGVNVSTGASTLWSDETGTTNNQAGIWQSGAGLMSDGSGRMFFTSGNGVSPPPGTGKKPPGQLAESVVRLGRNTNGSLAARDFFSPSNAPKLDSGDTDWGSGGPVGLPLGTTTYPHVLSQVGKDGRIFLLNRNNLGGRSASNNSAALSVTAAFNGEWGHPAVFAKTTTLTAANAATADDYLYYLGKNDTMRILQFGVNGTSDKPKLTQIGSTSVTFGYSSGSPAVTSYNSDPATAVVWAVYAPNATGGSAMLEAFPATPSAAGWPSGCTTGCTVPPLSSWPIGTAAKFTNITTNGGMVYVGSRLGATTSGGTVYGFGAAPSAAPVAPASQATFAQTPVNSTATKNVTLTATSTVTVTGVSVSTGAVGTPPPPGSPTPDQFTAKTSKITSSVIRTGTPSPSPGGSTPGPVGTATPSPAVSQAGFPVTLHKGDKLTVPVSFTPTSPGGATGTVTFATSAGPKQVALAATGTSNGLYANPAAVQFALVNDVGMFESNVPVGVQVLRQFDIVNGDTKTIKIGSVSGPAAPYQLVSGPEAGSTLKPGQSAVVQIAFTPTAPGNAPATYSVTGSDGSTATVQLTGAGLPPTGLFKATPSVVNFGSVPVGKTANAVITLTNTGNEPATVVTTSPLVGPFTRTIQMAPKLPVNASYDLQAPISFTPRRKGTFTTYYTFTWSDIAGTHSLSVKITGKGV